MYPSDFIPTNSDYLNVYATDAYPAYNLTHASTGGPDDFSHAWGHAAVDESAFYEPCMEPEHELSSNYLAAEAISQPSFASISTPPDTYTGIFADTLTLCGAYYNSEPSYTNTYPSHNDSTLAQDPYPIDFPNALPTSASPFVAEGHGLAAQAAVACIPPALLDVPAEYAALDARSSSTVLNSHRPRAIRHSHASSRASAHAASSSSYPTPSLPPSPPPLPLPSLAPSAPPSPELISCTRRNAHVSVSPSSQLATSSANPWKCPHCPYVQRNKRSPDLKRHVLTHTRPDDVALWVCCGVPLAHAAELGVPDDMVRGEPFVYEGMRMVGGCRKTFSRRDALKRHLRREAGMCFGDALALYLPGNRMSGTVDD